MIPKGILSFKEKKRLNIILMCLEKKTQVYILFFVYFLVLLSYFNEILLRCTSTLLTFAFNSILLN